jgi:putative lipoic acid-binding regulatory protein
MIDSAQARSIFPCAFPIKAIGRSSADFEAVVVAILRRHVVDFDEGGVVSRYSENGNYLSVTATFIAESREQLDAVYQELSSHQQVLMVL